MRLEGAVAVITGAGSGVGRPTGEGLPLDRGGDVDACSQPHTVSPRPMTNRSILGKLKGGDRRSIGRVSEVVEQVVRRPELLAELLAGLQHADPVVRLRTGDALRKVSRGYPEWLRPFRGRLLRLAKGAKEQESRWHLAQMLPRLDLTSSRRLTLAGLLDRYLVDASAIVRVSALQALCDLAALDPKLRRRALARVRSGLLRARRLLQVLEGRTNRTLKTPERGRTVISRRAASRTPRG